MTLIAVSMYGDSVNAANHSLLQIHSVPVPVLLQISFSLLHGVCLDAHKFLNVGLHQVSLPTQYGALHVHL